MKIIQDNYNKCIGIENWICEHCNSVFEFDETDIKYNTDGEKVVRCPCCNRICYVGYDEDEKELPKFPNDFYCFNRGVDIKDDEINKWIKQCIDNLDNDPTNKNGGFEYICSGNTFVAVFKHADDDEYYCIVAKNYFDYTIDK